MPTPRRAILLRFAPLIPMALLMAGCHGGSDSKPAPAAPTVTFSFESMPDRTYWVAVQDGEGPWKVLEGTGGTYTFTVNDPSGRYGLAQVEALTDPAVFSMSGRLFQGTVTELPQLDLRRPSPPRALLSGSILGLDANHGAYVTFGENYKGVNPNEPSFIFDVPQAKRDLAIVRNRADNRADLIYLRRDVDVKGPLALGALDLAQGSMLEAQTVSVSGADAGESLDSAVKWTSGTTRAFLNGSTFEGSSLLLFPAVPTAVMAPTDLHILEVSSDSASHWRAATLQGKSLSGKTVALPPRLDPPVISAAQPGSGFRPRMVWQPMSGSSLHWLDVRDSARAKGWYFVLTGGWAGAGSTLTYDAPDFTGLPGWKPEWGFTALASTRAGVGGGKGLRVQDWAVESIHGIPVEGGTSSYSEAYPPRPSLRAGEGKGSRGMRPLGFFIQAP